MDSKERFSTRVETYVKYRPGYPEEALDYLYGPVGFRAGAEVADVGAGTGIFSRLLLARGSRVNAVEPNDAMREAAERELGGEAGFRAVAGSAEATGLPVRSVDAIASAQAFHWFDQAAARTEFRRILKPGGVAALVWNARLTTGSAFLEEYEALLLSLGTDYARVNHRNVSRANLEAFFKDGLVREARFMNRQVFDFDGLRGRLLSSSYSPPPGDPRHEPMLADLERLFERNAVNGSVFFDYETEIYWGEV